MKASVRLTLEGKTAGSRQSLYELPLGEKRGLVQGAGLDEAPIPADSGGMSGGKDYLTEARASALAAWATFSTAA